MVEYVGSGFRCDPRREVDSPGADRVVIPIDAQLPVCRDAHHVGAFTVTEIRLDGGDVRHPTGGVTCDDRINPR